MPLYGAIVRGSTSSVRSALDLAWSTSGSVQQAQAEVEELIPDEDDEDAPADVALVQNSLAAVAYALRTASSHDAQDVVWGLFALEGVVRSGASFAR